MNTGNLIGQQCTLARDIIQDIENGKLKLVIKGDSGCGKSYLSEWVVQHLKKSIPSSAVLYLQGDEQCVNRDYYPFFNGMNNLLKSQDMNRILKSSTSKIFDFTPIGGEFLAYVSEIILNKINSKELFLNHIFNEEELDIVLCLKKASQNKKLIIFLDNLHWWDEKSLTLLYLLLQHSHTYLPDWENAILIGNITENQTIYFNEKIEALIQKFDFSIYRFKSISLPEYNAFVKKWDSRGFWDNKLIRFLWKITGGHLEVTKRSVLYEDINIFEELNGEVVDSNYIYLNRLIEKQLNNLGATGSQIDEVLQFASLLGISFSLYELEKILNANAYNLRGIIEEAQNILLINSEARKYYFCHEIIRELFKRKTLKDKTHFYPRIIECFKQLYPTNYSARIKYLLTIGDIEEIEKIYILDIMQHLQSTGTYISNSQIEILLSDEAKFFLADIKKAIIYYQDSDYNKAAEIIESSDILYNFDLCAYKDILLAQCYTKVLDERKRWYAVEILEKYKDKLDSFSEKHIWLTSMLTLLDAYIHIGHRNKSLELMKILYSFCADSAEKCKWYQYQLNILRRKSMAVYELEISEPLLRKSVNFFEKNNLSGFVKYPIDYYITLVNYGSVLICSGKFMEAHSVNQKALKFQHKYSELKFPRAEILINNFFMSGVLCEQMDCADAINNIKNLLDTLKGTADIYFLKSNLSIYLMMDGKLSEACEILEAIDEEAKQREIKEYSYFYHAEVNLAIAYIMQKKWVLAKSVLDAVEYMLPEIHYSSFYKKRHLLLLQIIKDQVEYETNMDFMNLPFKYVPTFQSNAWKYFGLIYSYNTLEHWGES